MQEPKLSIRQHRIRVSEKMLGLKEDQHLTIPELEALIEQGNQFLQDCGPFDPAYEHLFHVNHRYRVLRYQLQAEQFGIDQNLQASMESALGRDNYLAMFDQTEDQLIDKAGEWEKKSIAPSTTQFDKKIHLRMRDVLMKFIDWRAEQSHYKETRQ